MLQRASSPASASPVWQAWRPSRIVAKVSGSGWFSWWSRWRLRKRAKPNAPSESNRREAVRYNINLETSCLLIAAVEGDLSPVRVRNISAGGISLVLNHGCEPDTIMTVQLLNRPRMYMCKVDVRITYIVEHPSGDWILGGAFNRKLTDEELRSLLARD
ncbi:MAG: hypothetical protein K2R98_31140 [Gemmataceae bacterium]|nr:hypothetical protein [Gemmataceae bacterium]